jgi:hypothetical protein
MLWNDTSGFGGKYLVPERKVIYSRDGTFFNSGENIQHLLKTECEIDNGMGGRKDTHTEQSRAEDNALSATGTLPSAVKSLGETSQGYHVMLNGLFFSNNHNV